MLHQIFNALCLCLILLITESNAFVASSTINRNKCQPKMIFGKKATQTQSKAIEITVKQKFFKDTNFSIAQPGNLRKSLLDKGVDLYPLQGKIYNCGGGGSCGTCAVKIDSGMENCSPKGPAEKNLLKGKPDSFRLSCCTKVNGNVTVTIKP
mmetsp:Transcript_15889/g.23598  ORF Transcript_15889/g.23598 Transcript_15889/m.23598 type:complete len:152 (-) Transcript_15889:51-506(-)